VSFSGDFYLDDSSHTSISSYLRFCHIISDLDFSEHRIVTNSLSQKHI